MRFYRSRAAAVWIAAALGIATMMTACGGGEPSSTPAEEHPAGPTTADRTEWFTERAEASGIDFTHVNGASGKFYYPEILPPGVALFDFDNDGDLDVYLVQGHPLDAPTKDPALRGRLYRNDLEVRPDGSRTLHFTDVTGTSGIDARGFGFGVAAGDVDNDGFVDLYLTAFGGCQLYRNNGNGTFTDITAKSGTANQPGFGVSAAFVDYDRDGLLDLYVGNNVNYPGIDRETVCPNPAGARDYCPPQIYGGFRDRLYHNDGGRFTDVTAKALVGLKPSPALGVSTADFDGDGWIDIYVANDGEENFLWLNQKNGTFREVALGGGAAVTAEGKAEASMGVDAGDYDDDGDEDLIMTELTGQGFNLYVNEGAARFRDQGALSGLGPASTAFTGWGTSWFDYDNDGRLDTFSANGTIIELEGHQNVPFPYDQHRLLFRNLGNGRLEDVSSEAGASFQMSESGRGAAFGDVDNDGDVDILVGNDGGKARLLINNIGNRQHWVGLRLTGQSPARDMLGARVAVRTGDGLTLWRRVRSDGSYASANDPRVLVGLGAAAGPVNLEIQWPDGRRQTVANVAANQWHTIQQGSGE